MDDVLRVGDVLHGYCGGEFGSDSYECKRVEAIGADWVVVRTVDEGYPQFARGEGVHHLRGYRTPTPGFYECDH